MTTNDAPSAASTLPSGPTAQVRIVPELENLEWLHAAFASRYRFALHSHTTYAVGVIESGIEGFRYRGARRAANAGKIVVINPLEPHDGYPVGGHFGYRMLYPSVAVLQHAAGTIGRGTPWFPESVIDDPTLARMLVRAHRCIAEGTTLQGQTAFYAAMQELVQRHGRGPHRRLHPKDSVPPTIRRARDYLSDHVAEAITLDELAELSGLPPHALCRQFRRAYGLPPHAWQIGRRITLARDRLRQGQPIATVALALGFNDQAHFHRCFRQRMGVTPGQYRAACKNVQDCPVQRP